MKYLNINGTRWPAIGSGTWELEGDACRESVRDALEIGYRSIDTARAYENETEVGEGIRDSGIARDEILLTSKIFRDKLGARDVRRETEASLKALGTDYLDLLLIHWPNPEVRLQETLEAMLQLAEERKILRIGVSNFPLKELKAARSIASIFCDQVEYHAHLGQSALLGYARETGMMVTAYSPLGSGEDSDCSLLERIGEEHDKSAQQVALRWLIQQAQVAAIPRSSSHEHRQANFEIFDFELTNDEMARIDALPKDRRQIDPKWAPEWD